MPVSQLLAVRLEDTELDGMNVLMYVTPAEAAAIAKARRQRLTAYYPENDSDRKGAPQR